MGGARPLHTPCAPISKKPGRCGCISVEIRLAQARRTETAHDVEFAVAPPSTCALSPSNRPTPFSKTQWSVACLGSRFFNKFPCACDDQNREVAVAHLDASPQGTNAMFNVLLFALAPRSQARVGHTCSATIHTDALEQLVGLSGRGLCFFLCVVVVVAAAVYYLLLFCRC